MDLLCYELVHHIASFLEHKDIIFFHSALVNSRHKHLLDIVRRILHVEFERDYIHRKLFLLDQHSYELFLSFGCNLDTLADSACSNGNFELFKSLFVQIGRKKLTFDNICEALVSQVMSRSSNT